MADASRVEVARRLRAALPGRNLYDLAHLHGVTVRKNGRLNKGWVGQTLERVAGLPIGNAQSRDGFDFELKSTSLIREADLWSPKETIRITQLTPSRMVEETFETSALWNKLERLILVGCHHVSPTICEVVRVATIDLNTPALVDDIRAFWQEVQLSLCLGEFATCAYHGSANDYIQLRPTGDGRGWSTCPITGRKFPARAFYATKRLVQAVLS